MTTLLRNLGDASSLEECRPLRNFKLWNKNAELVSGAELAAAHKQIEMSQGEGVADRCMYALVAEAMERFVLGELKNVDFINYQPPVRPMTSVMFAELIESLTVMEASAVFFALENKVNIHNIVTLTWKQVLNQPRTRFTRELLFGLPRHFKCELVFWHHLSVDEEPCSLAGLPIKILDFTQLTWGRFMESVSLGRIDFIKARDGII